VFIAPLKIENQANSLSHNAPWRARVRPRVRDRSRLSKQNAPRPLSRARSRKGMQRAYVTRRAVMGRVASVDVAGERGRQLFRVRIVGRRNRNEIEFFLVHSENPSGPNLRESSELPHCRFPLNASYRD
jgi:hypothetical protein